MLHLYCIEAEVKQDYFIQRTTYYCINFSLYIILLCTGLFLYYQVDYIIIIACDAFEVDSQV